MRRFHGFAICTSKASKKFFSKAQSKYNERMKSASSEETGEDAARSVVKELMK